MVHRKYTRTLGRLSSHRISMMRNMALSLFSKDRIETTHVRAQELSKFAEKLITLAKRDDLASKRRVFTQLRNKDVARRVFDLAKAQYSNRNGGYTRIIKFKFRKGDAAPLVLLELVL